MAVTTKLMNGKKLSMFSIVMINVIAVDSLRSLTVGAQYGFAIVFFYLLASLLFFIPSILVTAELATGWPNTGGVYVWVREAFGSRWGFMTIWLQWIYNVVWYPTIFSFVAGILAYLIDPALVNNKIYMLTAVLIVFWTTTALNCLGLRTASWVTTAGAILGTILPMLFIAILGLIWLCSGKPSHVQFSVRDFFPNLTHLNNLAFIPTILFGLLGMEMAAIHAGDVKNPARDYPRALTYSAIIILVTLVTACLAITIVIPVQQLNLVSGLIDAFAIFFKAYGLSWMIPVIGILIMLGGFAGAAVWVMGPARALLVAAQDSELPRCLERVNRNNMPVGILLAQGLVVTLLSTVFLIMPNVNSSYWVLSNLTAQLALIFYILMFAAAIRLHFKHPQVQRAFRIPGGKIGILMVGGLGIFTCVGSILLGFLPPSQVELGKLFNYEAILVGGIIVCCGVPFLIYKKRVA